MPTKRPRLAVDGKTNSTPARASLPNLPIEILAEILFYTRSLPTVVAVARTCSFLYHSLARNPGASFIWRDVRRASTYPLPDPGDMWKGEADYAAFVFGGGECEVCGRRTRAMYVSFSARVRLCGSWHCRSKYIDEFLIQVTTELDRLLLWVPPLESTRCFYSSRLDALMWPRGEVMLRKRDWEVFRRDLQAYKDAEKAHAEGNGEDEWCRAAMARMPRIMEASEHLIRWKWDYDCRYREIKKHNAQWTKSLADQEGWNLDDLVMTESYGSLQRCRNSHLETIESQDVNLIRPTIESELLALKGHHQRQKAEATYKGNLTGIKKLYEQMRCGTLNKSTGANEPLVLPPLSVFCTLPSVRALKGSPDPGAGGSASVAGDMHSPLVIALVKQDVQNWLKPVEKRLMALLGYPSGWDSASTRAVHPLKRATARFFCQRCGEGNVGRAYRREQCLDFKGVCSHVCKKGGTPLAWTVDVFEKDGKAIAIIKAMLNYVGRGEDSENIGFVCTSVRCMTCPGWIVMDFETAIGHAHRHEAMEVQLPTYIPTCADIYRRDAGESEPTSCHVVPMSRITFEQGNVALLLGPSRRAKKLCQKINYGCKHCLDYDVRTHALVGMQKPGKKGSRAMNFHGLRSHLKGSHGVHEIRDEDFFCYTGIQE